jgi:hypothetical protein
MKCQEAREKLAERLVGPLEAVGELKLSAHAEHCADCAGYERKLLVAWESLTRWSVAETSMTRRVQILGAIHDELRRSSLVSLAEAAASEGGDTAEHVPPVVTHTRTIAQAPIPLKRGAAAVRSAYLTPRWITAIAAALLILMIPIAMAMFGGNTDVTPNGVNGNNVAGTNGVQGPLSSHNTGPQGTPDLDYTPSGSLRPRLTDTPLPMNGNHYDALVALDRMTAVERDEFLRNLDLFRGGVNFVDVAALSAIEEDDWDTIADLDIVGQVDRLSWGTE